MYKEKTKDTCSLIREEYALLSLGRSSLQGKSFHLQDGSESTGSHKQCFVKCDLKQRIDAMFDDTRSTILDSNTAHSERAEQRSLVFERDFNGTDCVENTVQARIENMFADVSRSERAGGDKLRAADKVVQRFQVEYIGSLPLLNKVATLEGLQEPLKNLYFNYRKNMKHPLTKSKALLEITRDGLKMQNCRQSGKSSGVEEQLNPFASIAVWAALKFVYRSRQNGGLEYAFLPIIVDKTSLEKSCLFRSLYEEDVSCAIEKTYDDHSPLFVVIMRQSGRSSSRLRCHGFACSTSEDAVLLAANLYKALAATVTECRVNNKTRNVKCSNGLGTVTSVAGSSVCGEQALYTRPPQIKSETEQSARVHTESDVQQSEIVSVKRFKDPKTDDRRNYKTTTSSLCSWQSVHCDQSESGDILTKVVIPQSKRFLNASSRYNSGCNTVHSPLGFVQLFNELQIHEGLNNIDDILNAIIDVDGMSFNRLKPIYKEFLFKLAVTLTKDELYQKSKLIMQKQKRRKRQMLFTRRFLSNYKIKKLFHKSVDKFRPIKYKLSLPLSCRFLSFKSRSASKIQVTRQNVVSSAFSLNNSFVRAFSRRNGLSTDVEKGKMYFFKKGDISFRKKTVFSQTQIRDTPFNCVCQIKSLSARKKNTTFLNCSSPDSDSSHESGSQRCYCSLKNGAPHLSSVSSCSCDTESCIESEKCYCSRHNKPSIFEQLKQQGFAASESSVSRPSSPVTVRRKRDAVSHHTKSCLQPSKSLEFFHVNKSDRNSRLKKQNSVSSERFNDNFLAGPAMQSLTIDSSDNSDENHEIIYSVKKFKNFPSNEIENLHTSREFYSQNKNNMKPCNTILVVSTRDQKGHVRNSVTPLFKKNTSHNTLNYFNATENDAISVKKTAEIAAVFSGVKVEKKNQMNAENNKDDVCNYLNDPEQGFLFDKRSNNCIKSFNLENSLGYFP